MRQTELESTRLFYPKIDEWLDKAFNCQDARPALYPSKAGQQTFIFKGAPVQGDYGTQIATDTCAHTS